MALNPQFPNYANGPAGTEVIGWTVVGGQPLYRLPVAYVNTGFGAAFVCEGSTIEAPTFPEGVYDPDPAWESAGTIIGTAQVGQTLTFTPGTVTGTAPITETYNWIRYIPGGQSVIVGTGLNYSPVEADLTHTLVVQSVATNTLGSVATQTLPYGPVTPAAPVITNAGTITSVPPNPSGGTGTISAINVTNGGANYVWALGAIRFVTITGDGSNAVATANLNPVGNVIDVQIEDSNATVAGGSGQITLTGEGSETPLVIDWATAGPGTTVIESPPTFSGGQGWTQANLDACVQGTYGTISFTGTPIAAPGPTLITFLGCPIQTIVVSNQGAGYTVAAATVDADPVEAGIITPAVLSAVVGGAGTPIIYPTQQAVYSGPTVTGYSPQVSWVWGYGSGADFTPFQLGGTTFRVPVDAVGKEIFVQVTATNTGGSTVAYSAGIVVEGSAPQPVRIPKIGPFEVTIGDTITGQQGTWSGYPQPQVTDWGFALFSLPNPVPIPEANKVYTYKIPQGAEGNRYMFYVTAENSSGSDTAYSLPTDAVYDTLSVVEVPRISYTDDLPTIGTVLRGTPAVFFPTEALQYSYFAYLNPDGTITEIAGTQGTNSYTCLVTDVGKKIVYASYGECPGLYGPQTLTSHSNSAGPIREFAKILTPGSITFAGAAPQIGELCSATWGTTSPPIGSQVGGPTVTNISVYYREESQTGGQYQYNFIAQADNPTTPLQFTVPVDAYGWPLVVSYEVEFRDAGGTGPVQTLSSEYQSPTPEVDGTKPTAITDADWDPANQYNPGYTLTWNPGTFSGNPTPTVTWAWYRNLSPTNKVLLQNGGLTYTLPDDSANWIISVEEFVTNVVGTIFYDRPKQIGGPLPVWTRNPVVTGSGLMTPTQGTSLSGISPLAKDPTTEQDIPVDWNWYYQFPGQAATVLPGERTPTEAFLNENGKWTGAQIFIRGTATNAAGTVTIESNKIYMVGTPRILSQGNLYSGILPNRFGLNPCTSDGGGQTVTNSWSAEVIGPGTQVLAQVIYPATQTSTVITGNGVGQGVQAMRNSQGETIYNFPTINVQFP